MAPSPTSTSSPTASATCLNVSPGKNGYLPPEACDVILYYVPSLAAAVLFCVLYGLTTGTHIAQGIIYKKRYTWVIAMGGLWELLAFIFRALQTHNQASTTYDTMYTIFFLLAPIWINAFLYMTLGRMLYFYQPGRKIFHISARRFGTVFVCLDIFAFIVQVAGALMSSAQDSGNIVMTGLHIYMGGIGLQEFFILCFTALAVKLHRGILQMERRGEQAHKLSSGAIPWRWLFYAIYFALVMITVRIIFRIAQYGRGTDPNNPVLSHEAYEYVFDAVPMLFALVTINIFHPGRNLQGPDSKLPKLSRAEKKALKNAKAGREHLRNESETSIGDEGYPMESSQGRDGSAVPLYHPV